MSNSLAQLSLRVEVSDNYTAQEEILLESAWRIPVRKQETVTISAATFTALTPPTGAAAVLIDPGTNISSTLKGVTGDTGVKLLPASSPLQIPILLPLGASPSIGILNSHSASQDYLVYWL